MSESRKLEALKKRLNRKEKQRKELNKEIRKIKQEIKQEIKQVEFAKTQDFLNAHEIELSDLPDIILNAKKVEEKIKGYMQENGNVDFKKAKALYQDIEKQE